MKLTLPWPPSANHYYRRVGPRTLISRAGREYRRRICGLLAPVNNGMPQPPSRERIALCLDAFPPDRRRRDLDNLLKCTQDSLAHAGVYEDDGQIDVLSLMRRTPVCRGQLVVTIEALPLWRCPLCGQRPTQHESEPFHGN